MSDTKGRRVLVIDDDPFMLKLLLRMLAKAGHGGAQACDSGAVALERLADTASTVELILLDINMPGMDGVEFIRRLGESGYHGSVILVSGEDARTIESVERLLELHHLRVLGRLQKPVRPERLAELLARLDHDKAAVAPASIPENTCALEELRAAIAQLRMVMHYQPKVSLETHEVIGMECLVRWQPQQGPLIYPDQFLPLAERHGLMGDITRLVLDSAMRQAREWRREGLQLNVAINVSMSDLASLEFPDMAAKLAETIGLEASAITLEVTETTVVKQLRTALDVLSRLRLKRFRLSIDDFGTGHASLAQLRDLPFDELKVDRSFVTGASANLTLQAICDASVRVGQQLRMQIVAEGIEQPDDWDLLSGLGCGVGQGYLIARPMPGPMVLPWLRSWNGQHASHLPASHLPTYP